MASNITSVPSSSGSYSSSSTSTGNENVGYNSNAGKKPVWNKPNDDTTESGSDMEVSVWPPLSASGRALSKSSSGSSRASLDGSSSYFVPVSQGSRTVSSSSSPQKQIRHNTNLNPNVQRTVFVPFTGGNDQRPPQNSFRPRHSVPHQRGEGSHHLNYGGRHHQYRGNQNWNSRNFINRDIQPRGVPRFMRHPPPPPPPINTGALFAPSHVHSFGPPMGFHEYSTQLYLIPAPHQELYRGVSYFQPVHPMFLPTDFQHQQLHAKILNQINYYFSNENLIKDTFLRQNMDDQGWVHVKLIAGFRKIVALTNNIQVIVDALKNSTVVEVQGDKIRRQNDWKRWILPPSVQFSTKPGQDVPVAGVRSISSEQGTTNNQIGSMS